MGQYAVYEAYSSTIELNTIFDVELREFLHKNYQLLALELPILSTEESVEILITATFDHSQFVELAVTELEERGIAKEKIFLGICYHRHDIRGILWLHLVLGTNNLGINWLIWWSSSGICFGLYTNKTSDIHIKKSQSI